MSESALFIVGALIFAITVYGVVMAGGLMLTRRELEQDEDLMRRVDQKVESGLPMKVKY